MLTNKLNKYTYNTNLRTYILYKQNYRQNINEYTQK